MLEKPTLAQEKIIACIQENYGVAIRTLEFLPIGYNPNTWVYQVTDSDGQRWFLKVNRAPVNSRTVLIPQYLHAHGIPEAVAPLPARTGVIAPTVEDYHLVLYPYIDGQSASQTGMAKDQWRTFGNIAQRIHSTNLPSMLRELLPRETFEPRWLARKNEIESYLTRSEFETESQRALAAFWNEKSDIIERLSGYARTLGAKAAAQATEFVLCHADIHIANVLTDARGQVHVVDWDQPVLAPRECDFLFVLDSWFWTNPEQEAWFFEGYGDVAVNRELLTYYQAHRTMDDLTEFAAQVFVIPDTGYITQQDSAQWFKSFFKPGGGVDQVLRGNV